MKQQNLDPDRLDPRKNSLPSRSLLSAVLKGAGRGLLEFAKFSGLVITTNLVDMEQGFISGGEFKKEPHHTALEGVRGVRVENTLISCIYLLSNHKGAKGLETRESLNIIRKDMPGGAILEFTDDALVGGITNGVSRFFFAPQETEIAERLLLQVRDLIKI